MALPDGRLLKVEITLDSAQVVATSETDFIVLLNEDSFNSTVTTIMDGGADSALNNGGDLAYSSDEAGLNELSRFPFSFVTSATLGNTSAQVFVKVPSISGISDTKIWCWYKKVGATQPPVGAAFGRNSTFSDWEFFSVDGVTDLTGHYPNAFSIGGNPTVIDGPFTASSAYDFDGANDWLDPDVSSRDPMDGLTGTDAITMEVWTKSTSTNSANRLIALHGDGSNFAAIGQNYSGDNFFIIAATGTTSTNAHISDTFAINNEHFVSGCVSLDQTTHAPIIVVDGNSVFDFTRSTADAADGASTTSLRLGARNDGNNDYFGFGGEFRYGKFLTTADRLITGQNN